MFAIYSYKRKHPTVFFELEYDPAVSEDNLQELRKLQDLIAETHKDYYSSKDIRKEDAISELSGKVTELTTQIVELDNNVNELKNKNARLENECNIMKSHNEELKSYISTLANQNTELINTIKELTSKVELMRLEKNDIMNQLDGVRKQLIEIYESRTWKATKPVRLLLDSIKKIIKKTNEMSKKESK